ncbi:MAG: alpha/beta hydrolase [Ktedonobacterales bacterium]
MVTLLVLSGLLALVYSAISVYAATLTVANSRQALAYTPGDLGLAYSNITFPSRDDHIQLKGWLIPGELPDGSLTVQRTIIMVHGNDGNRADKTISMIFLEAGLVRHGFAVLTLDLRGLGESPDAPNSLGYFEYRDVLGAVDFLRSGEMPFPSLGRPRILGGWGISKGGVSLMLAAARESAIRALVADSSYPDMGPILEREIPSRSGLPPAFTPGILFAARVLYGIDFYAIRPRDVFGALAPRPIFFIEGDHDDFDPPANLAIMTSEASAVPGAHVQSWQVPHVTHHAQCFNVAPAEYIQRVVAFYTAALGSNAGS